MRAQRQMCRRWNSKRANERTNSRKKTSEFYLHFVRSTVCVVSCVVVTTASVCHSSLQFAAQWFSRFSLTVSSNGLHASNNERRENYLKDRTSETKESEKIVSKIQFCFISFSNNYKMSPSSSSLFAFLLCIQIFTPFETLQTKRFQLQNECASCAIQ